VAERDWEVWTMPRHVLTMLGVVGAFFVLLWVGVVLLKQSPGVTLVVSLVTLVLVGVGITFSVATLREDGE
jgi:hypothetical protein